VGETHGKVAPHPACGTPLAVRRGEGNGGEGWVGFRGCCPGCSRGAAAVLVRELHDYATAFEVAALIKPPALQGGSDSGRLRELRNLRIVQKER